MTRRLHAARWVAPAFALASALALALASGNAAAQPAECREALDAAHQGRQADALVALNRCLDLDLTPGARAFVLQVRAEELAKLKRTQDALKDQLASLHLAKPRDVWPLVMLGVYYRELKQYEPSLEALKEALDYDEDGPGTGPGMAVHYHTGWTLHEAGRYAEAIEAYTRGVPKQPDYGYAFYRRGLAYEALHDRVKAKQDFLRAAQFPPDAGYEADVRAKLKEYGVGP